MRTYSDRYHAGKILAESLTSYMRQENTVVLAIPRGGVPVAYEVARLLSLPLDVLVVQKLSVPGMRDISLGSIAENDCISLNEAIIQKLGIRKSAINHIINTEYQELMRRESVYHEKNPLMDVENKTVIIIDDGICTGSSMRTAIQYLESKLPASIVIASPVAKKSTCEALQTLADAVICLELPNSMETVDLWYQDYSCVSEFEVLQLLNFRVC